MRRRTRQRSLVLILSLGLLVGGYTPVVDAGLIGVQDLVAGAASPDPALSQSVAHRLAELGVEPRLAQDRVAALSHAELRQLDQHLEQLPAGASALAVIGTVFLVLLILELVGVTNIFNKI